jgi:hypothetical protein
MSYLHKTGGEPSAGSSVEEGETPHNNISGGQEMERKQTIYDLAVRVCGAVRGVRGDRQTWIGLELVHREMRGERPSAIDAAVAFAAAKGWLAIGGGRPSHSVMLGQGAP